MENGESYGDHRNIQKRLIIFRLMYLDSSKGYLAFLPMSIQPLHNGHINFILNVVQQFPWTHVTINEDATTQRPFPIKKRMSWLEEAFHHYGLHEVTYSSRDDFYQYHPEEVRGRYLGYAPQAEGMVLVSGNAQAPEVASWMGVSWLDTKTMSLEKLVPHMPDELLHSRENNAGKIRQAVMEGRSLPQGYLPDFIRREELERYLS